jgi:hypothetical protein
MGRDSSAWAAFRPKILASVAVGHEGSGYTMAVCFTSQEEAREGERKEPPPELQAQMGDMAALSIGGRSSSTSSSPGCTPHAELDSPGLGSWHPRCGWPAG